MVASALGTVLLLFYSEVAAALEGNTGLKKLFFIITRYHQVGHRCK